MLAWLTALLRPAAAFAASKLWPVLKPLALPVWNALTAAWRWNWRGLGNAHARAAFLAMLALAVALAWGWVRPVAYHFPGNDVVTVVPGPDGRPVTIRVPGAPVTIEKPVTLHHWPGADPVVQPGGAVKMASWGAPFALKTGPAWTSKGRDVIVTLRPLWWRSVGVEAGACGRGPVLGADWRPFAPGRGINVTLSAGACWPLFEGAPAGAVPYVGLQAVLLERLL
jgi:hypothetical protein